MNKENIPINPARKRKILGFPRVKRSSDITTSGQEVQRSTAMVSFIDKLEAVFIYRSRRRKGAGGVLDKSRAGIASPPQDGQSNAVIKSMPVPQSGNLCDRCSQIDFDKAFARVWTSYVGNLVLELGDIDTWDTSCVFCELMSSLVPVTGASDGAGVGVSNLQLRSYFGSTAAVVTFNTPIVEKTVCLGIASRRNYYPLACIVSRTGPKDIVRQLRCDWIDYGIILGWLEYCRSHHTVNCVIDERKPVKYLKLIDCRTRKIIVAGDQPYVTLSYVWGKALDNQRHHGTLPDNLPMTIEDSIKVAMALGFQYIWIDRYCIDQSRPTEVRHQVDLMDLIYSNSELTIIAAAGEDPFYGLPGVSNRARATQIAGQVGNRLLLSAMGDPTIGIYNSVWHTRGWTYQEGLLARRRLVFTDQQIYFECHSMYCSEGLNFSLDELHDRNRQAFQSYYCSKKGIGIFPQGVGTYQWSILGRIEEYTKRALTNDADILNGFKGVMRVFRSKPMQVETIYGIPFFVSTFRTQIALSPGLTSSHHIDSDDLDYSFATSLLWWTEGETTRRVDFPSWSWSGWHGPVLWPHKDIDFSFQRTECEPKVEMKIRLRGTGSSKWHDLASALKYIVYQYLEVSKSIMIKGPIVTIDSICNIVVDGGIVCQARTQYGSGGYIEWSFKATTKENLCPQDCIGISVAQHCKFDIVLVLKKFGTAWERVAIGFLGPYHDTRLCNHEGICELDKDQITRMGWRSFRSRYGIGADVDWFELI